MTSSAGHYALDTHALVFWANREHLDDEFADFLDERAQQGELVVSAVCFWEIALLAKKGRLVLDDVRQWKDDLIARSGILLIEPTVDEMIASTQLPDLHKDPFDRLLVAQAQSRGHTLVTRDALVSQYEVEMAWG